MRPFSRAISSCIVLLLCSSAARASVGAAATSYWLVYVNKRSANALVEFSPVQGRIHAHRAELKNVGLEPGEGAPDDLVALDTLPGATYVINEADQSIHFEASPTALATAQISGASNGHIALTPIDPGFVLNYDGLLSTGTSAQSLAAGVRQTQGSLALDARAFSPWGQVTTTALAGATQFQDATIARLDSAYEYRDHDRMLTTRAGDTISGGFAWSRPIRIGGVQVRREFGMRSDLVTTALPTIRGAAAVPTTVDVFVNNIHAYSTEVGEGPFQINQIPMLTGAGQATIVTRDVSGREVRQDLPFFSSAQLLRAGLYEFSFEAGYPRVNYGLPSDAYQHTPVGIGSGRIGVSDRVTIDTHVEGAAGLVSGGVGVNVALGGYGVLTAAASGSRDGERIGAQIYAAAEFRWRAWAFNFASQRADDRFSDLAAVAARSAVPATPNGVLAGQMGAAQVVSARPNRALDRASVSTPIEALGGVASLSFVRQVRDDGADNRLVLASLSRSWSNGASLSVSGFGDVSGKRNLGLFVGFSKRFGDVTSTASARNVNRGLQFTQEASRSISPEPGSYGWRIAAAEGGQSVKDASASYRTSVGRIEARVQQASGATRADAELDGAIGLIGGQPFASNHVRDSFALVKTGVNDVAVLSENRPAGRTGWSGSILIPDLRAFERNKIELDVASIPEDHVPAKTEAHIVPAGRGGVLVDFAKVGKGSGAVVSLVDARGQPLPVGSYGRSASGEDYVVGYDGQVYLSDPDLDPVLTITLAAGGACRAALSPAALHDRKSGGVACL